MAKKKESADCAMTAMKWSSEVIIYGIAFLMLWMGASKIMDFGPYISTIGPAADNLRFLPSFLTLGFIYAIPFVEVAIGILLAIPKIRPIGILVSSVFFMMLAFGSAAFHKFADATFALILLMFLFNIGGHAACAVKK